MAETDPFNPHKLPIEDVLDLHTVRPQDIKELLPAYFEACREQGIFEVRVVHGKGIGNLRRTVEALLPRLPGVESFAPASQFYGGTGATIVWLKRTAPKP
jgi:DNA-nicking Smr family endonuclease